MKDPVSVSKLNEALAAGLAAKLWDQMLVPMLATAMDGMTVEKMDPQPVSKLVEAFAAGLEAKLDAVSAALTAAVSEALTEHTSVTPMARPWELMMGWDWVKPMGQKSE
jgi:hypothetical protein